MSLRTIVSLLEACKYECEAGPLENNLVFLRLKEMAQTDEFLKQMEGSAILKVHAAQALGYLTTIVLLWPHVRHVTTHIDTYKKSSYMPTDMEATIRVRLDNDKMMAMTVVVDGLNAVHEIPMKILPRLYQEYQKNLTTSDNHDLSEAI